MESDHQELQQSGGGYFVTTRWSLILEFCKGRTETEKAQEALSQLCRIYWKPIYNYIRQKGYQVHDAKDLAQDFFMKVVSTDFLLQAEPERGKFRSFLQKSLQNFLTNQHIAKNRQKREGSVLLWQDSTAEDFEIEYRPDWSSERIFDIGWAATISDRALAELHEECVRAGREKIFTELSPFLSTDVTGWDYEKAAEVLGVPSNTVRTLVHRLRGRYRSILRAEVAETVNQPEEIEEELRYLHLLLAESPP